MSILLSNNEQLLADRDFLLGIGRDRLLANTELDSQKRYRNALM